MTDSAHSVQADLTYLKSLAQDGGGAGFARGAGPMFVAGGGLYGAQCLLNWAGLVGWFSFSAPQWLFLSFAPSVLFAGVIIWRGRRDGWSMPAGATGRAAGSVFASLGLTNMVLIAIFAPAALSGGGWDVWLFYPAVVFALSGGAWLSLCFLRKRLWLGLVAVGWFAAAIALGALIGTATYFLAAGLALIALMALPGAVMVHLARKAAS